MKKWLQGIIAICSILIISACGSSGDNEQVEEPEIEEPTVEISDEEKLTDDEVVVLVNDNEVHGKRYNIIYPQIKMYATQMEEDVELDEIKERTIDALIDQELIYQGA